MSNQLELTFKNKRKFNDAWAFVLFVLLVTSIVVLGVLNRVYESYSRGFIYSDLKIALLNLVTLMSINIGFFILNMYIPKLVIYFGLVMVPLLSCGIYSLDPSVYGLLFPIVAIVGSLFAHYVIKKKMHIICTVIKTASRIIAAHILPIMGIYLMSIIFAGTIGFFVIDLIEIRNEHKLITCALYAFGIFWVNGFFGYFFQVFVSSIVIGEVIKNTSDNTEESNFSVCKKAIYNTLCAMGSIAFGSLILAFIKAVRFYSESVLRAKKNTRDRSHLFIMFLLLVRLVIMVFLEEIVSIINKFGFPYCALKGTKFIESLREAHEMLNSKENAAIETFVVIDYTIFAVGLLNAVLIGSVNFGYFRFFTEQGHRDVLPIFVFSGILSSIMHFQFISVLNSGTIALSYAELVDSESIAKYSPKIGTAMKQIRTGVYE